MEVNLPTLEKMKQTLGDWSRTTYWIRSDSYRFQFRKIQLEVLLAVWEVLEAVRSGRWDEKRAKELRLLQRDLTGQLEERQKLSILVRSFEHRVEFQHAQWMAELLELALELWTATGKTGKTKA